jgi:UDP-glucose 4-epimerase
VRSVLVTGGAGFIGSHLVEELVRRDARVTVVDNLSTGQLGNLAGVAGRVDLRSLDLRSGDLRPILAEHPFDVIFHLAGNVNVPWSVEDPRSDLELNLLATFNLLEAVRDAAPRTRVIHSSTAAVYGDGARTTMREDHPTVPVAPYGASKRAAELYVGLYARLYGLRTAIARLFSAFGPRLRKQVVYDLMRKIHDDPQELFIYGDGTQVRDLNHVANIVEALLVVAERACFEGEAYNVAAEEPVAIRDLARMLCEQMGADPRFVYSGDVRPGDAQRWCADIGRLKSLGYQPRLGLADGLADTVAWFRRELAAPVTI